MLFLSTSFSVILVISLCCIILISVFLGKVAPKPGLLLIFLVILVSNNQQIASFFLEKETPKQALLENENIKGQETVPIDEKIDSSLIISPNIKKSTPKPKKKIQKFITKVKIAGISNELFNQKFENESGYSLAKKGDYLITFSHTGNIKSGTGDNRFIYSGGDLIVKIGKERCCCNGQISIPENMPLGNTIKDANKILAKKIEEYTLKSADIIIPMIADCLPNY